MIGYYIHSDGKIGAMVELNSETDFVARNEKFKEFAHELAIQIVASNPKWINRDEVPEDEIEQEKSVMTGMENKPEHIKEKIIAGRLEKFYKDFCLMDQVYVRDPKKSIGNLFDSLSVSLKEKIVVKRFCRFRVGE